MNTAKNIVVIMTLLGVGYGAHKVLNEPLPDEFSEYGVAQDVISPQIVMDASAETPPREALSWNDQEVAPQPPAPPAASPLAAVDHSTDVHAPAAHVGSASPVSHHSDGHSFQSPTTPASPTSSALTGTGSSSYGNGQSSLLTPGGASSTADEAGTGDRVRTSRYSLEGESELEHSAATPARTAAIANSTTIPHLVPSDHSDISHTPSSVVSHEAHAADAASHVPDQTGASEEFSSHSDAVGPQDAADTSQSAEATSELADPVQAHLDNQDYSAALRELSQWYLDAADPVGENSDRVQLMDQLAGTVVYSRDHMLERPHVVMEGESLEQVAARYSVPPQLLANVNGLHPSQSLLAGQQLKIITGPFHGLASVSRRELTLFVGPYYAGRFPIRFGDEFVSSPGVYEVVEKATQQPYTDPTTRAQVPAGDPLNPYGRVWIGLSSPNAGDGQAEGQLAIHGVGPGCAADDRRGCIRLIPRDAEDLFAILSKGSTVTLTR